MCFANGTKSYTRERQGTNSSPPRYQVCLSHTLFFSFSFSEDLKSASTNISLDQRFLKNYFDLSWSQAVVLNLSWFVAPFQRLSTLVVPCSPIGFYNITTELLSKGLCWWFPENRSVARKGGPRASIEKLCPKVMLLHPLFGLNASFQLGVKMKFEIYPLLNQSCNTWMCEQPSSRNARFRWREVRLLAPCFFTRALC